MTFAPRLDASIAALVRVAAARRGRTRKCDIGIGTGPNHLVKSVIVIRPSFDSKIVIYVKLWV